MRENILIVGADSMENGGALWRVLADTLRYQIIGVETLDKALEWLKVGRTPFPDIVLLNEVGEGNNLLNGVQSCKKLRPELPLLLFTPYGNETQGMEAIKSGAFDFISKPVTVERLQVAVQNALKMRRMSQYVTWLERKAVGHTSFEDMVGESPLMKEAIAIAARAASSRIPVWIEGETGTGKTLLARAIHGGSERAGKPFVAVNCELLPEHLAPGMLFGQESVMPESNVHFILGKIREADQGTLLLQNPGILPPDMWEHLLSALHKGSLKPQGAAAASPINVRLICADSMASKVQPRNLAFRQMMGEQGEVVDVTLPPLLARSHDIRLLAQHFLLVHATSENKYITSITERALVWLEHCQWPGNVGELANAVWRAVMLCENPVLDVPELRTVQKNRSIYLYSQGSDSVLTDDNGRAKSLKSVQQEAIRYALQQENGCMTRAARSLGIGRSTLYRKVQEYDLVGYISRANQTTRPMMNISSAERS
jgi:DNA-binding NtrC family response regulator